MFTFNNFKDFFKSFGKKKIIFSFLFLVVIFGVFLFLKNSDIKELTNIKNLITKNFVAFEVSGSNFDLGLKKLPFNAKSIDLTFSMNIDEKTINQSSLKITPAIDGKVILKTPNTISFVLNQKLEISKDYTIVLSKGIKSTSGDEISEDLVYMITTVPAVSVIKFLPEGQIQEQKFNNTDNSKVYNSYGTPEYTSDSSKGRGLKDTSKNIAVFFSLPMVSFTNLEEKNNLPCPLELTPKVEGKCTWTTTSVLEFIPTKPFVGATKYEAKIINKAGINYELEKPFTTNFETPHLSVSTSSQFVPKNYIRVNFNYPVDKDELAKNLIFSGANIKVENILESESSFLIKPVSGEFYYDSNFSLTIKKGLKSKYGNIPLENDYNEYLKSTNIVSNISYLQNELSSTGLIIGNKNIKTYYFDSKNENNELLPTKNLFLNVSFYEEMPLNKSLFKIVSDKNEQVNFKISYTKKYDEKNKEVDNKEVIRVDIIDTLKKDTNYNFIISKSSNTYLKQDIINIQKTAGELKIVDYKFLDYSRSCLYINYDLPCDYGDCEEGFKKTVTFSNSGIIRDFYKEYNTSYEYLIPYEDRDYFYKLNEVEKENYLLKNSICKLPNSTETKLYVLNTRLNPNTDYNFKIKDLEDKYGNILKDTYEKSVKTADLKSTDKFVYTSFPEFTNFYPKDIPIVINAQTTNTSKVGVEACEMNESDYLDYLKNRYTQNFVQKCSNNAYRVIDTKLKYWNLTNNRFDLETDIIGQKSSYNYILVNIYTDENRSKKYNYVSNLIIKSNLITTLEKASNKSILFATDIKTKEIVENLKLTFYDSKFNKVNIPYTFNTAKKVYEINGDINAINLITAQNENYYSTITDEDSFSNYDFKYISGQDSSVKDFLYTYTDRPIYRPNDEVFIKGLLRTFEPTGFKKSKIKSGILRITDENGGLYRSIDIKLDDNSNFTASFVIPKETTLGNFNFAFQTTEQSKTSSNNNGYFYLGDSVYTGGNFYIEEYRKPTFKVDIDEQKNEFVLGEKLSLKISPKYYFGGKMINTDGNYSILTQNYMLDAKEYSDFQFGTGSDYFDCMYWGYCNYSDLLSDAKPFKIDQNGEYIFDYDFGSTDIVGEKIYSFNFSVTDPDTKKTVNKTISKTLHTTDAYVGVKADYYNDKKAGINMSFITLDNDSKILPNKDIKVKVTKRERKNTKKLGVDGIYYNDYSLEEKLESTFDLKTDDKAEISKNYLPKESGEYEILVSYTGDNKKTFSSSSIVYVAGEDYVNWRNDNNTVTELVAEKGLYKIGETANFVLKSPVNNGKVLIVVEKDDGILDYFIHEIKSYGDNISIKVDDNHYPNVYLKAFLIGTNESSSLPVYKRALSSIKVLTDYKKLNIVINPEKKNYNPGEKVKVEVSVFDKDGKIIPNANGSLSVVDESVLALKGNPKKNPYAFFYEMKRYLGVVTYSNLKNLVEKLEIKDTSSGEKGGAGDQVKGGNSKKSRGIFKDTAVFVGNFTTDKNGKANLEFTLPDNLTTWVIEALVNTPLDNKIGVNYETIITNKQLMIVDNLPRYFAGDDKITISPVIYNRTGKDGSFRVTIKADNVDNKEQSIDLLIKNQDQNTADFEFKIDGNKTDVIKFQIDAVSIKDTNTSDSIVKYIPIKSTKTPETVSTIGKTDSISFDEKIDLSKKYEKDGTLTINYGGTLFSYILDIVNSKSEDAYYYDYGYIDSKTSLIMPYVYIKKLYNVSNRTYDLKNMFFKKYIDEETGIIKISVDDSIKNYLIEMKKYQNTDGGFMYYYDTNYKISDHNLTAYIVSSISNIKDIGYEVDNKIIDRAITYLKDGFYNKPYCEDTYVNNCLTLNTKLLMLKSILDYSKNDYEVYKMYKSINEDKFKYTPKLDRLSLVSKIVNIESLSKTEKDSLIKFARDTTNDMLTNELVFNPRGAYLSSNSYSRVYNTSIFIEVIANIGKSEFKDIDTIIDNMIRFIAFSKKDNSFGNYYDDNSVMRSLTSYLEKTNELKNTSLVSTINLNSKQVETKTIDNKNIFDINTKKLDLKDLSDNNILNFTKSGTGNVYYDLTMDYFIPAKNIKSADEGFFVEKTYFSYEEYKKVESLKNKEFMNYLSGSIKYDDLKYPNEVVEYLKPISFGNIGDLVLVYNRVINSEARDKVSIESYIPSGSEIINTKLDTEDKTVTNVATNIYFDREEFRDDKYFAYSEMLDSGIHNFSYTIRLTHKGEFNVKPTIIKETYNPEVFGRSSGVGFEVK